MSIPIINSIPSFDANSDYSISFIYQGNQVFKNEIKILKNIDNSQIFDDSITSFLLSHTIPKNTLTNGEIYNIKLRIFDKDNNASNWSDPIVFTCHAQPVITTNITPNQIVQSSYLDVDVNYSSSDGESLNTFQIILYDSGKTEICHTDIIYFSQQTSYRITALEDSKQYYVQVVGTSVHKMNISTVLIPFSAEYIRPTVYSPVELTNNSDDGTIEIQSYLLSITGKANPDPTTYINNSEVDLTSSGSYVTFDEGFNVEKDFSAEKLGRKMTPYSVIDTFTDGKYNVEIRYMKGTFSVGGNEQVYFLLTADNGITQYRITSTPLNIPTDTQKIRVAIKRQNNLFDIVADYVT